MLKKVAKRQLPVSTGRWRPGTCWSFLYNTCKDAQKLMNVRNWQAMARDVLVEAVTHEVMAR